MRAAACTAAALDELLSHQQHSYAIVDELCGEHEALLRERCRAVRAETLPALTYFQLQNLEGAIADEVALVLKQGDSTLAALSNLGERRSNLHNELAEQRKLHDPLRANLLAFTTQLHNLERVKLYFEVYAEVNRLRVNVIENVTSSCRGALASFECLVDVYNQLQPKHCGNLSHYARQAVDECEEHLASFLQTSYRDCLKSMHRPVVAPIDVTLPNPTAMELGLFRELFEQLIGLQLCLSPPTLAVAHPPPILTAISLLLRPVVVQFRWHFRRKGQPTNRIDKPEWFLTFVLNTITDNDKFAGEQVQPLLDGLSLAYYDARVEFARGLVEEAESKLRHDLPAVLEHEEVLLHTVSEVLRFRESLNDILPYPKEYPSCVRVFLDSEEVFEQWVTAEKRINLRLFREVMNPDSFPWRAPGDADSRGTDALYQRYRYANSALELSSILFGVSERYRSIPSPKHQFVFVQRIQHYLLNEYLELAVRLFRRELRKFTQLGQLALFPNSLLYIEAVLQDWASDLHLLELVEYQARMEREPNPEDAQSTSSDVEDERGLSDDASTEEDSETLLEEISRRTVFDGAREKYSSARKKLLGGMVDAIVQTFVNQTEHMMQTKRIWQGPENSGSSLIELSPELCNPCALLKHVLSQLEDDMAPELFQKLWRNVAYGIGQHVFEQLMAKRLHFTDEGLRQFQFDMQTLFHIFRAYSPASVAQFTKLVDSMELLALYGDDLEEFREEFVEAFNSSALHGDNSLEELLATYNVYSLSPNDVETLLTLRVVGCDELL